MAPKRQSAFEKRATEEVKRYKESVDKVKEEFMCPITVEKKGSERFPHVAAGLPDAIHWPCHW